MRSRVAIGSWVEIGGRVARGPGQNEERLSAGGSHCWRVTAMQCFKCLSARKANLMGACAGEGLMDTREEGESAGCLRGRRFDGRSRGGRT
ncbi:hypothetical protein CEB3_c20410 [Peptococcaceae bacterium CEB3]|nr:hypothetical protein CEB3_c20410 [Peptococcaceae bacterium CEB3]